MEEDKTPLQILFEDLPISLLELSRKTGINEVTIARVRDGKPTRRATANKLLLAFGEIYGKQFNLRNVTGINVMVNKRLEKKEGGPGKPGRPKKGDSAA
jgi:predicted transcriptional regulator